MAPSVQELWKCEEEYYKFCREERNIAAILYHALLLQENLSRFLKLIGCKNHDNCEEASVYFEYAYLRDLWNNETNNDKRKNLILDVLEPKNRDDIFNRGMQDFNKYFGGTAKNKIQDPGRWSIKDMDDGIKGCFFLKVCKFKWAFNIKPDIVIHTSKRTAVCIEAKLESSESTYPSDKGDKDEFHNRLDGNKKRYRQTDIQKYMFEKVLGMEETKFVLLGKPEKSPPKKHETPEHFTRLTWGEAFCAMDVGKYPEFLWHWVNRIKKDSR